MSGSLPHQAVVGCLTSSPIVLNFYIDEGLYPLLPSCSLWIRVISSSLSKGVNPAALGPIANGRSSEAIANRERKVAKSSNKHGNPISMKSKVLAAISDPADPENSIFVAESAGFARRISLGVCLPLRQFNRKLTL